MIQAAKRNTTRSDTSHPRQAFIHPDYVPKTGIYALIVAGNCLEPTIPDGAKVVVDPTQEVKQGDLAVFYLKEGCFSPDAGTNLFVKRVVLNMMPGVKFPYKAHPNSNVMPIFLVEQDNPPRQYQLPADQILAVHKCLGVPEPGTVRFVQPKKRVAASGPDVPDEERTIADLCREWKIVGAKLVYDLACLPEVPVDKEVDAGDLLCTAANDRQHEIEAELADRKLATVGECEDVLTIVLANLREYGLSEDEDKAMLTNILRGLQDMVIAAKRSVPA